MQIRTILYTCILVALGHTLSAQLATQTPFEQKGANYSATYEEAIGFYKGLEATSSKVKVLSYENGTDAGEPLHLVVISGDGKSFHPEQLRRMDKRFVLINNGIHPGEPCGVDASMILARDLVEDPIYKSLLDHIVVLIVPVYNVGGALNRGAYSRANQNGPAEHGFRGNGRLLDLNRDFIKADSRNARSFMKLFAEWRPDIFIDTHTSNGADYPYFMTYIPTQKDKLETGLADYMETVLNPFLEDAMAKANYEMCPYVQTLGWSTPPDSGLVGFLETPRYSTGYAALFNTIGYTTEAHMLKNFEDRVYGTYHFLLNLLIVANRDRKNIERLRDAANDAVKKQETFTIRWKLDRSRSSDLDFKGYAAVMAPSGITGMPRIAYDREQPWRRTIPHYNNYVPDVTVQKPVAYILPQAWGEAVERMQLAGVEMKRLSEDVEIPVEVYYVKDWKPATQAYEGHWPLSGVSFRTENQTVAYRKGDYVIYCDQTANRYIVETLEPQAHDSFFYWNFFDEILQRKEYFSAYVFEKTAREMMEANPQLKEDLAEAIRQDSSLLQNDWGQMDFIYRRSQYYEPTHLRYPVGRMESSAKLPLDK